MANLIDIVKREMELRNYSRKSIAAYLGVIKDLYRFYQRPLQNLTAEELKNYLHQKNRRQLSSQTIALAANAINYLFIQIYKRNDFIKIKQPKRTQKLPEVLSREEVKKILDNVANAKHRLIIALAYGAGLRVSEVVRVKVQDIDFEGLTVKVRQGKGKKDRLTVLPETLRADLRKFAAGRAGDEFLFVSERGGGLTEATAQKVFYKAAAKSQIKKPVSFHSLRHSFATHLLENGVDVRYVQELLGHASIRTTQIYTRVTNPAIKNIKSPL